jgi:hypothetical protein
LGFFATVGRELQQQEFRECVSADTFLTVRPRLQLDGPVPFIQNLALTREFNSDTLDLFMFFFAYPA